MTKAPKETAPRKITESSGNVFADLGLPNPEQELMKAELTLQIYRIIKQRGMTQVEAAKALGIKQPHVSLLMRNRAGSFSVGRLMEFRLLSRICGVILVPGVVPSCDRGRFP